MIRQVVALVLFDIWNVEKSDFESFPFYSLTSDLRGVGASAHVLVRSFVFFNLRGIGNSFIHDVDALALSHINPKN